MPRYPRLQYDSAIDHIVTRGQGPLWALAELYERFSMKHPDSSSDMVKRAKRLVNENHAIARRMKRIQKKLGVNPETRA